MQCSLDLLRNIVIRVQVRSKVLVRELLRAMNLRLVSDPVSNVVNHCTCCQHIVSQQCVQVHTQCLRTHFASKCSPNLSVPWQHLTSSPIGRCRVRQRSMLVLLRFPSCGMRSATELQLASRRRQPVPTSRLLCQSTNRTSRGERYPSASSSHTQDIPQARIVTDRRAQQLSNRSRVQPALECSLHKLDKPTRPLPSLVLELAGSDHLEHCAQNATVIDHAIEYSVHQLGITNRQRDQQCSRHVLHERLLTSVQSQLRQVLVIVDSSINFSTSSSCVLSRAVERVTERTCCGDLSQGVFGSSL